MRICVLPTGIPFAAAILMSALFLAAPLSAQVYTKKGNLALDGYDPVTYFVQGAPIRGKPDITSRWNGAVWQFTTAENKAAFDAAPQRYAPQYGGYCAWAAAQDKLVPGDPDVWKIVNGKLYINFSSSVQRKWEKDTGNLIRQADANWPALSQEAAENKAENE